MHFGCRHGADKRQPLATNIKLRRNEEEGLAAIRVVMPRYEDRPAQCPAELIQHEMIAIRGTQKEIECVEGRVAMKLIERAVKIAPARFQRQVGDAACRPPELSVRRIGLNLELLNRVNRRKDDDAETIVVFRIVHALDQQAVPVVVCTLFGIIVSSLEHEPRAKLNAPRLIYCD